MSLLTRRYAEIGSHADYLRFTAEQAGSTVKCHRHGTLTGGLYASFDCHVWFAMPDNAAGESPIVLPNVGDSVFVRGELGGSAFSGANYLSFVLTGAVAASGNAQSILGEDKMGAITLPSNCFMNLFMNETALTAAPKFPATRSNSYTFYQTFKGCTGLREPADVRVRDVQSYGMAGMYEGCVNLLRPMPMRQTGTAGERAYQAMYKDCPNLIAVPRVDFYNVYSYGLASIFSGCTSLRFSETQTDEYRNPWKMSIYQYAYPQTGWNYDMLKDTGGTFTGNPAKNVTYYTANDVVEVIY